MVAPLYMYMTFNFMHCRNKVSSLWWEFVYTNADFSVSALGPPLEATSFPLFHPFFIINEASLRPLRKVANGWSQLYLQYTCDILQYPFHVFSLS